MLGRRLDKRAALRMSNWEAAPLSAGQRAYAAADAYASLRLLQARARGTTSSCLPYCDASQQVLAGSERRVRLAAPAAGARARGTAGSCCFTCAVLLCMLGKGLEAKEACWDCLAILYQVPVQTLNARLCCDVTSPRALSP